ncbi:Aspartic proteinase nepenthesin-2 [Linum perenne]
MDVFIGTPPKHFSLILDTGSDLNWIQCVPCHDCFEQNGPIYDPRESNSYRNISCHDPRCQLVSSPDPPLTCKGENQSCPYYYWIKSVVVGGEVLDIPEETWNVSADGSGGTIVDSGTTLSYFTEPAYRTIRDAFVKRVRKYPVMDDVPVLDPCYNVSGAEKLELPEFKILFADGAVWDFPVENYFIWLQPGEVVCLAILGTPRSALSIIGNYQQQNFHILYDTKRSRIGYAPMKCADV